MYKTAMDTRVTNEQLREGYRITVYGVFVNVGLTAVKFVLGFLGRSQALVADAVHSLSDLITDAVVMVGLAAGRRQADDRHHFGHGRMETMAAAFVAVALAVVAVYIGMTAAASIYRHDTNQPSWIALAGAALSILTKEILFQATARVGRRIRSKAVVANAWHHRSDAFSSIAVLLGVGAACIRPDWHILDAYAALLVSVFILKQGISLFLDSFKEFTDTAPEPQVLERINGCICKVKEVINVHDLKVRTSADMIQMQVHIVVDRKLTVAEGHRVAKEVENCLFSDLDNLLEVVVHVDPSPDEKEPKS
ncbi:MAG: cation diffusion facilitator family transporter [Thermodesulfobacteriota bacterium]